MTKFLFRICILISLTCGTAAAQDVVSVRAGEHASFSRLVIQPPTQLWELQQSKRRATLTLNNWNGEIDYSNVFDRIPRTRLLGLTQDADQNQTTLTLSLACDCDVTADLLGALLVLDINDAVASSQEPITSTQVDAPSLKPKEETAASELESSQLQNDNEQNPVESEDMAPVTQKAPLAEPPQGDALAAWLAERLETAAERGFVELSEVDLADDPQNTAMDDEANDALLDETTTPAVLPSSEAMPSPPEMQPETVLGPAFEGIDELENLTGQLRNSLSAVLDDDVRQSLRLSVPETTESTNSRSSAPRVSSDQEENETVNGCIPDHFLFAPSWIGKGGISKQIIALRSEFVQEFDKPNSEIAKKLALLYIASGMGLEALAVISELEKPFEMAALYKEIAEIVEGLPFRRDGILQAAAGCPGRSALWRTIAIEDAETQPILDDDALVDDFSELPLVLRRVVGPRLVQSLLARNQAETARRIFSIVDRAAGTHGPAHELVRAQFLELEGRFEEAKKTYALLVVENSFVAPDAMTYLVSGMLDRGEKIDPDLLEQLETEAFRHRKLDRGQELRVLEIRARAQSSSLDGALNVVANMINQHPERRDYFMAAATALLEKKNFNDEPIQDFVRAIYAHWQIVTAPEIQDAARENIADHLYKAGLPNGALVFLGSLEASKNTAIRDLEIRALLATGRSREAFDNAVGLGLDSGPEKKRNAAHALFRLERHGEAFDFAREVGLSENEIAQFGWRAGSWEAAQKSDNQTIANLAQEMLTKSTSNGDAKNNYSPATNLFSQQPPSIEKTDEALKNSTSIRTLIEDALAEF